MAKWRVEIDLAFDTEEEVVSFANLVEELKAKVYKFDHALIETETKARYHLCFHDEVPPKPCGNYVEINFGKPEKDVYLNSKGEKSTFSSIFTTAGG